LSFEDEDYDSIDAFLCLHLLSDYAHCQEVRNAAIVREVKVFGRDVSMEMHRDEA